MAQSNRDNASAIEMRHTVAAMQQQLNSLAQERLLRSSPGQSTNRDGTKVFLRRVPAASRICWACNSTGHFRYQCPGVSNEAKQQLAVKKQEAEASHVAAVTAPKLFVSRILVHVGEREVCALLDSCAPLCLIGEELASYAKKREMSRQLPPRTYSGHAKLTAANGTDLQVTEELEVDFQIAGRQVSHYFLVIPELSVDMLLATDFVSKRGLD